jgi:hypothetical protein
LLASPLPPTDDDDASWESPDSVAALPLSCGASAEGPYAGDAYAAPYAGDAYAPPYAGDAYIASYAGDAGGSSCADDMDDGAYAGDDGVNSIASCAYGGDTMP